MKKSDVITISKINDFKREAQKLIRSTLWKLFERSPLRFLILKSAAIFDPAKLREVPKEKIHSRWKMLLQCFIDFGILSQLKTQFKAFLDEKLKVFRANFDGFSWNYFWLDEFYFTLIGVKKYDQVFVFWGVFLVFSFLSL